MFRRLSVTNGPTIVYKLYVYAHRHHQSLFGLPTLGTRVCISMMVSMVRLESPNSSMFKINSRSGWSKYWHAGSMQVYKTYIYDLLSKSNEHVKTVFNYLNEIL